MLAKTSRQGFPSVNAPSRFAKHAAFGLSPQGPANGGQTLIVLGVPGQSAASAACSTAQPGMRALTVHNLVNIAWSFAKVGFADVPFLQSMAASADARLHEFSPQSLANTAWSFATMKFSDVPLLDALS
mmetsp:Transcript_39840/g.126096  ORF Transcript_39840/g.126096 Transcript_39840/m.126096 type:complete len:129 (+) Transcript_39840:169-555(+)